MNLPAVARSTPGCKGQQWSKPESRVKCFYRWLKNGTIQPETYFIPFAHILVQSLSHGRLYLVIDGSTVGRGCMMLMVGVVYKKRTLPIAWMVAKKRKGHFSEAFHLELIRKVEQLIPEDAQVTLLGDGEFDGVNLQALVHQWHWDYVLRTGKNITLSRDGTTICYEDLSANIKPGELFYVPNASFSNRGYGPVLAITVWREGCKEPIHLVTNMGDPGQAYLCYCKRFRIETFFSDQKSRGFHLNKSHLSDPERICRFMIAASLAYFWVIYLGVYAINFGYHQIIHRTDRCDLSLFQLGLRLLDYLLDREMPIPWDFHTLAQLAPKSVR